MEILKAENLVKYYGKGESLVKAVDHSSFSVASGEFVAIVGTSGSGKSTILNLVGGLDTPDEGRVIIDGQDISKMTQDELTVFRRRKIGFIFQNYNLVSVLNVYKNIVMPVKLDGSQVDKAYISRIMKMLGIENKRKGNLDSKTSQEVMGLLKMTSHEFQQTVIMITHNEEIAQMADRIIHIEDGKILGGEA